MNVGDNLMENPVLVEVKRGGQIESRHRGAVSVMDCSGSSPLTLGNIEAPVFPRSAVKAIQALPLIESGAADAFAFTKADLALACSSHSGEDEHIERARAMLSRAGKSEDHLECGGHWSSHQHVLLHQSKYYQSTPGAICNNCSGKHAGFVCTTAHLGINTEGYIKPSHDIMKTVRQTMEDVTGADHKDAFCATDGCSIPTYAIPLSSMAHGFAKMGTGNGFSPGRASAAKRLVEACMAEPFYVAGSKRFCTELMTVGKGRIFAKTGAEGVYCGAIPELGLGIALKCEDGTSRAAEVMMAATVSKLLPKDDPLQEALGELQTRPLKNWNNIEVGSISANLEAFV